MLRRALLSLFQNGPDKIDFRDKDSNRKAEVFLQRFDATVDMISSPISGREMDEEDADRRYQLRGIWVRGLQVLAERLLQDAELAAGRSSRRRFRAAVRARDRLGTAARFNDKIRPYLSEGSAA